MTFGYAVRTGARVFAEPARILLYVGARFVALPVDPPLYASLRVPFVGDFNHPGDFKAIISKRRARFPLSIDDGFVAVGDNLLEISAKRLSRVCFDIPKLLSGNAVTRPLSACRGNRRHLGRG